MPDSSLLLKVLENGYKSITSFQDTITLKGFYSVVEAAAAARLTNKQNEFDNLIKKVTSLKSEGIVYNGDSSKSDDDYNDTLCLLQTEFEVNNTKLEGVGKHFLKKVTISDSTSSLPPTGEGVVNNITSTIPKDKSLEKFFSSFEKHHKQKVFDEDNYIDRSWMGKMSNYKAEEIFLYMISRGIMSNDMVAFLLQNEDNDNGVGLPKNVSAHLLMAYFGAKYPIGESLCHLSDEEILIVEKSIDSETPLSPETLKILQDNPLIVFSLISRESPVATILEEKSSINKDSTFSHKKEIYDPDSDKTEEIDEAVTYTMFSLTFGEHPIPRETMQDGDDTTFG